LALGCDRRRLQAEPVVPDRVGRLMDDVVLRLTTPRERKVVPRQVQLHADHVGPEHPDCLLEQFLSGLIALEDHDRPRVHARIVTAPRFPLSGYFPSWLTSRVKSR